MLVTLYLPAIARIILCTFGLGTLSLIIYAGNLSIITLLYNFEHNSKIFGHNDSN